MNMAQRQILYGVLLSLLLLISMMLSFYFVFPIRLIDFWHFKVVDIPFALFAPMISILLGVFYGLLSGYRWQKQLKEMEGWLHEVEEGRVLTVNHEEVSADVQNIYQRIIKIQKQISEQAKYTQRLANEKAIDIDNRMQEIIYEERNRLARELHDSVSQQLFAASMLMSAIMEQTEEKSANDLKQLQLVEGMIHQSQLEMRALLLHLRPVALKGKKLTEGIEELLLELKQKVTMNIKWRAEDFYLDKGIEDHLFRILQESVSNTLRHAKADTLDVLLIQRDGFAILRIIDDGIGFNVDKAKAGSYGIQNMYERALEIGGTLKMISLPNKGTRLEVKVPIIEGGGGEEK
ncbi:MULTISPECIES: sensor histidine kinase [Cytobacillus]|uniref:Sensor histidine kinase n=1 Tax=Cytobacillus stercorigallinarum TaxID=2762240 RepID=A0ABR8QSI4_9BACI|nr:sensor histidine kinase [Cytobacillus stercorigallinarum]MBD7938505.1 sensor histidine kinase [Cytobacillus stercorigallinarum]